MYRPAGPCSRSVVEPVTSSPRSNPHAGSASTSAARWSNGPGSATRLFASSMRPERRSISETPSTVIVLSDVVPYADDLIGLLDTARAHSTPDTRLIIHSYSRLWRPVIALAERLRLKPRKPIRNWVNADDVREPPRTHGLRDGDADAADPLPEARTPALDLPERLRREPLAVQPPLRHVVGDRPARARSRARRSDGVGRLPVPQRARERRAARRTPARARRRHRARVRRGRLERRHARGDRARDRGATREPRLRSSRRSGSGKGDAVRAGFAAATQRPPHDPRRRPQRAAGGPAEVLPGVVATARATSSTARASSTTSSRARCGSRTWSATSSFSLLLQARSSGQPVKDTLCGTKVLDRSAYDDDRRRPRVLRRVRPVRRLRPAARRRASQPEDRRPAGPLPAAHVRGDEHQPLAPRLAAPPDDRVRVLEVPRRA